MGYTASTGKHCAVRQNGALMSELGQNPNASRTLVLSASTSCGHPSHRLWPAWCHKPTQCTAANSILLDHLVGAREHVGGTVSPSALAVTRLTTRSNLVGCSTGMSPAFAPRKILST